MKLRLNDLPDGQHQIQVRLGPGEYHLSDIGPVSGQLTVDKNGHDLVVRGRLDYQAQLLCSRCLQHYTASFSEAVDLYYRPRQLTQPGKTRDIELNGEDLNLSVYNGQEADLWPELREILLLSLPMKPVCREDCRGLCPGCGTDLNQGDCRCQRDSTDNRWDKLKELV